jgi:MFS family permease
MSIYFPFTLALFNMSGMRASRVLLALYALKLGAQPLAVGVLAATFSAFPMLLSWQAGKLADRFGSRWLLLFGAAGGACGMLVPFIVPGLPALYIAAALTGLSFAFYNVSLQNLVGLLSNAQDRPRNFSNFSLMMALASFVGPLLAGFSIDHVGYANACLTLVVLSAVPITMLAVWGGGLPAGTRAAGTSGSVKDMLAAPGVWRVLVTSSLVQSGLDLFQFYMPIYGHDIGLSASAIGMVLSMFAAAAFVVRMVIPRLLAAFTAETVLACSFCIGAASFMLVPFCQNALVLAAISFVFGLGMGCGQPITMMLTYSRSESGRSGEALGLRLTVNHLTRVVGPLLFGSIGTAFGLFAVFWANALVLGSGALVVKPRGAKRGSQRGD